MGSKINFVTNSGSEMEKLGEEFAHKLSVGDKIFLHGELGAGKTTFTKGLAKGLGIVSRVISPTFVLIRKHALDNLNFYHIDLYRIEGKEEIQTLGLSEIFEDKNSVVVVEWAERLREKPKKRWDVFIKHSGEDKRELEISKYE